jgi:hypothetical protein
MLEARGVVKVPGRTWVGEFIKYCNQHFAKDPNSQIVERVPRTQDQQRAGVTPEVIAHYFCRLELLLTARKFRAVRPSFVLK